MILNKQDILNYLREIKPVLEADGLYDLGLFGSYAKGKATDNSDIDICYQDTDFFYNKYRGMDWLVRLNEIEAQICKKFNKKVEFVNIDSLKNKPLFYETFSRSVIYV